MDKIPLTIRVTAGEKQMLRKRAARYGMSVNSLIRFWVNSEPTSPRAFTKVRCSRCNGTGKIAGEYSCDKCRGAGFSYFEI
jgi:RecJ-like exonuclease